MTPLFHANMYGEIHLRTDSLDLAGVIPRRYVRSPAAEGVPQALILPASATDQATRTRQPQPPMTPGDSILTGAP